MIIQRGHPVIHSRDFGSSFPSLNSNHWLPSRVQGHKPTWFQTIESIVTKMYIGIRTLHKHLCCLLQKQVKNTHHFAWILSYCTILWSEAIWEFVHIILFLHTNIRTLPPWIPLADIYFSSSGLICFIEFFYLFWLFLTLPLTTVTFPN